MLAQVILPELCQRQVIDPQQECKANRWNQRSLTERQINDLWSKYCDACVFQEVDLLQAHTCALHWYYLFCKQLVWNVFSQMRKITSMSVAKTHNSFVFKQIGDQKYPFFSSRDRFSESHFARFKPLICYHASHNPHQNHTARDYGNFCHLCTWWNQATCFSNMELSRSIIITHTKKTLMNHSFFLNDCAKSTYWKMFTFFPHWTQDKLKLQYLKNNGQVKLKSHVWL